MKTTKEFHFTHSYSTYWVPSEFHLGKHIVLLCVGLVGKGAPISEVFLPTAALQPRVHTTMEGLSPFESQGVLGVGGWWVAKTWTFWTPKSNSTCCTGDTEQNDLNQDNLNQHVFQETDLKLQVPHFVNHTFFKHECIPIGFYKD